MSRRRGLILRVLVSLALTGPMGPAGRVAICRADESQSTDHAAPTRFTPIAQQFLKAAKARLEAQQQAQAERERAHQREAAERLAIQLSQQKLKQQAAQERDAQHQLQLARERQLKSRYARALSLYKAGGYREAIELLQQMALLDPNHPLVKSAERLISRAEMKQFEQQLRAPSQLPPSTRASSVSDLEQLLTQKRIELETVFKFAKTAADQHKYGLAQKLLTAVLVQDPSYRGAQSLLEQVQLAQIKDDRNRFTREVQRDEKAMDNEVIKAEVLPETRETALPKTPRAMTEPSDPALAAKLQQPISFQFSDVALGDVMQFIADASSVSIIPSPQLDLKSRRVSLKVSQLPLEQAVKYLAKSLSLAYRIEQDAILIATPEEFSKEPLQTRVFFLRNGLGPFALEASATASNKAPMMESIVSLVEHSIPQPPDSKLVVDERSGGIIVTNTVENLHLVERLLGQLDTTPVQVLIEARFIELTMTDLEQLGIEAVLNGNASLLKTGAPDGTRGASQQIASGGGFKFPALARKSEALNLTLQGVLTGTQFEAVLHMLQESNKSKTLSAPRVTTLNNQPATIRVVEEFNYPARYKVQLIQFDINGNGNFNDAGETQFVNVPEDFQKREVGILLNVTPSVGKDLKTITLVLAPEVSAFSQFRDLGGGVTVPEFTSSELTTSVVIEDGQTVVLGGLMKDTTTEQVTKVPVLGDLPLLGGLFRQKETSSSRKNLLIFITARLLAPRGPTT